MENLKLMPDEISKLERVLNELNQIYSSSEESSVFTLPEIFDKQGSENFISAWLAYLLNPNLNGFGTAPLNALLLILEEDSIGNDEQVLVSKEYTFDDNGRRIDILIKTSSCILGIENKLFSGEQVDQTSDYWKSMEKLCVNSSQRPIGVYLKPDANSSKPCSEKFKVITYKQLCESFRSIPYDYRRDSRKNFFYYEFILYVEEKLMSRSETGYPKMSEDVELYRNNKEAIERARSKYDAFSNGVEVWVRDWIETQSYFKVDKPAADYMQIREDEKWRDFDFHFELYWGNTRKRLPELTNEDEVLLYVHLERAKPEVKKWFNLGSGVTLDKEKIIVNFTNEDQAKQSIQRIIDMINSEKFQHYAKLANDALR